MTMNKSDKIYLSLPLLSAFCAAKGPRNVCARALLWSLNDFNEFTVARLAILSYNDYCQS